MQKNLETYLSNPSINVNRPVHIIGGGGVGMSALALLLIKSGFHVSASDKNGGKYLEKLKETGAVTWTGSNPANIPENAVIFYSTAVPENDAERVWATEKNMPLYPRHILLKTITEQYYTIGISGTHGKTTTTGWIAFLLEMGGFDPNALVGGTLVQWNSNVRLGNGKLGGKDILVIEADESDESFLAIESREVIVTNIELDHVDRYTDIDHVREKFQLYIENCQKTGGLFFPSFEVQNLMSQGMNQYDKINEIMNSIRIDEKGHGLYMKTGKDDVFFEVGLAGLHNLWNAFAVLIFARFHGITEDVIRSALLNYRGVERRMQKLAEFSNKNGAKITVVDDYAHHPTEVKMVLETLLNMYSGLIVVWEPHRISRMTHFSTEFESVFESLIRFKNFFIMPVFDAAGEKHMPEFAQFNLLWNQWLRKSNGEIKMKGDYKTLLDCIHNQNENTAVVFLGAGHSSEFAADFCEAADQELVKVKPDSQAP